MRDLALSRLRQGQLRLLHPDKIHPRKLTMADSKTRIGSTYRNVFILLVGAATVAGAVWWASHSNSGGAKVQKRKGDMPVAVAVATVQKQDVGIELTALGTVTSTSTVTVRSRVDGQLVGQGAFYRRRAG